MYLEWTAFQGVRVEVVVRDTGVGIAESDLPRIFDRFHRSETGPGSAIFLAPDWGWLLPAGLWNNTGTIEVQSREGRGQHFHSQRLPPSR